LALLGTNISSLSYDGSQSWKWTQLITTAAVADEAEGQAGSGDVDATSTGRDRLCMNKASAEPGRGGTASKLAERNKLITSLRRYN